MKEQYEFSVQTKLCAFVCTMLGVFLTTDKNNTWILALMGLIFIVIQRQWHQVMVFSVFYGILSLLLYMIRYHELRMPVLSEFHIFMFWWLSPVFIVAWNLVSTPPGKLSAFFSKINAPAGITLGMLVVFRFFPTMRSEMRGLRESMHNRGLSNTAQVATHPAASFEYVLVPMLMRCLQISDQLSVSAVSRGIETPGKRESYYNGKVKPGDIASIILYISAVVIFLIAERQGV